MMETEEIDENLLNICQNDDGSLSIGDIVIPPARIHCTTSSELRIQKLELNDFKSYAGQLTVGPFKEFTTIVGPNGSGKSNVIDALLFVFGSRSQRIRSKKIGALIHKSDQYHDLQSCSVAVHFLAKRRDKDGNETVHTFNISRTAYENNTSTYEINGKRSQYKEVNALLRQYGIDLDYSRFLILQGEIEQISIMKAKGEKQSKGDRDIGMLEYIEDLVGSDRYIEGIEHFDKQKEFFTEEWLSKISGLKLIEKEMQGMEAAKNKALEYIKMRNEMLEIENAVLQLEIEKTNCEIIEITETKVKHEQELNSLQLKEKEFNGLETAKEKELEKLNSEYKTCWAALQKHKVEERKLKVQENTLNKNLQYTEERMAKYTKEITDKEKELVKSQKELEDNMKKITQNEEEVKKLEAKKLVEAEKLDHIRSLQSDEVVELRKQKRDTDHHLTELNKIMCAARAKVKDAEFQIEFNMNSKKEDEEALQKLLNNLEKEKSLLDDYLKEFQSLQNGKTENEAKIQHLKKQLANIVPNEAQLMQKREAKFEEVVSAQQARAVAEEAALSHSRTMLDAFLKEKQRGNLTGVYGRLGDLGTIPDKYNIAVASACSCFDYIVTDTMDTAKGCVEFLKKSDLGYSTFIALDHVQYLKPHMKKISSPENVPRLFDLVHVKDDCLLPAFYYALRNTLVADDLDQATRIGLQGATRHRVVTLNGELIDLSGTMTGGGQVRTKGLGLGSTSAKPTATISQEAVDKLKAELKDLDKEVADFNQNKLNLEHEIAQIGSVLSRMQSPMGNLDVKLRYKREDIKECQENIEKHKKNMAAHLYEETAEKFKSEMNNLKQSQVQAEKEYAAVEAKLEKINSKLYEKTKDECECEAKVNKLRDKIDNASMEIFKAQTANKHIKKKQDKNQKNISDLKTNTEKAKMEHEELKKAYDEFCPKKEELQSNLEATDEECKEINKKKYQVASELKELCHNREGNKKVLMELKAKFQEYCKVLKEKEESVHYLKEKLSSLASHIIRHEEVEDMELQVLTSEEMANFDLNMLSSKKAKLKTAIENMNADLEAINEYRKKEKYYNMKKKNTEETKEKIDLCSIYGCELRKRRKEEFMRAIAIIGEKLKEVYAVLNHGGAAELELVDSFDPFEGVQLSVRPPKKSWKNIAHLSGGEKTLASLAFVFSLHHYKPTPFYVMDEIDAALDFRNVSVVAQFVKQKTEAAQFVIVSLRANMFNKSDHLLGIYKTSNCTKFVILTDITKHFKNFDFEDENHNTGSQENDEICSSSS